MAFHGGFSIFDFDFRFMRPQTSFFLVMFFHMAINIAAKFLVFSWILLALQLSLKHSFTGTF